MKSNFKIIFILSLTILLGVSCSKGWLDVNEDPNNPKTSTAELTLPAGIVSVGANVGGYYNLLGGFWSQYWSQSNAANQYKYIDQYQIENNALVTQNTWREMYANGMGDLQFAIEDAKAKENWTLYLMGTVVQAYGWQVLVDLYNDVPYSECFQGDAATANFSPKYEKGVDIYKNIIARIDTALSKPFNELSPAEATADMFWPDATLSTDARVANWTAFANTLKLKLYIRMMYVDPAFAQAGVQKLYDDGAAFLAEDAWLNFFINEENKDNPLYASNVRKLNVATNLRVSATLYRYLEQNADPRLADYASAGTPMPQGGFNIPSPAPLDQTKVAVFNQSATDPVYFISFVESLLLQAEVIAKGWAAGDDKALYDEAVTAAFNRYGYDAAAFLAADTGLYKYPSAGTFEEKQEAIMMAKWAAFAGSQGLEMMLETNRTHYPRISSVPIMLTMLADY
jgi:hypothetical protein